MSVKVSVTVRVSFRVIESLLLININIFLNYSLGNTNGASWCTFMERKRLCSDLVHSRSAPSLFSV